MAELSHPHEQRCLGTVLGHDHDRVRHIEHLSHRLADHHGLERIDAKIAELRGVRREVTGVMSSCDRGACVFADGGIGA
jgi:hypothetical protein